MGGQLSKRPRAVSCARKEARQHGWRDLRARRSSPRLLSPTRTECECSGPAGARHVCVALSPRGKYGEQKFAEIFLCALDRGGCSRRGVVQCSHGQRESQRTRQFTAEWDARVRPVWLRGELIRSARLAMPDSSGDGDRGTRSSTRLRQHPSHPGRQQGKVPLGKACSYSIMISIDALPQASSLTSISVARWRGTAFCGLISRAIE